MKTALQVLRSVRGGAIHLDEWHAGCMSPAMMNVKETLEALAERLQTTGVRTVFGEPISAEGRTIIPVARVAYGFGSGGGASAKLPGQSADVKGEGAGGGGGVRAVPAGVIEITQERTRFLPFDEWRRLAAAALIGFALGAVLFRRPKR